MRICTTLLLSCIKIQTSSNHSALDFATHKQVTGFLSLKLLCALFCHNQSLLGACKWGHASLAKLKRFSMTKERLFSGGTYQIHHKSFENGTRRRNCQGLLHFCFILRLSHVCLPKKAKTAASQHKRCCCCRLVCSQATSCLGKKSKVSFQPRQALLLMASNMCAWLPRTSNLMQSLPWRKQNNG